jgi:hypothetical protein
MKCKDIINFTVIRKLKERIHNICIIYNSIINPNKIKQRESEFYEVYTDQYKSDLADLAELRDNCLHTADLCNEILLLANTHHIKQYYINKEILDKYEFYDEYNKELEKPEPITEQPKQNTVINDEEDFW